MAKPVGARLRPRAVRGVCLLLSAAALLSALHSALGPLPALPPGEACPGALVLVRNARYLTRGNVGHWGYALFGLHDALARAPAGSTPPALTLFFDARVKTGDWVRAMVAAISRRHNVRIELSPHRAGRCAAATGAGAAPGSAVWAQLDANEARTLRTGREPAFRAAMRDVCGVSPPAGLATVVRAARRDAAVARHFACDASCLTPGGCLRDRTC